jgi:hypothetical protein
MQWTIANEVAAPEPLVTDSPAGPLSWTLTGQAANWVTR